MILRALNLRPCAQLSHASWHAGPIVNWHTTGPGEHAGRCVACGMTVYADSSG